MSMATSHQEHPRRFLFAMFQGGGNIPLILPVVARLVTAGHTVRVLAGPGIRRDRLPVSARFRERLAATGAALIPLSEPTPHPFDAVPPVRGLLRGWSPKQFAPTVHATRTALWSPTWAVQTLRELQREPTDALVSDFFLGGALAAAEAARVPSAALVHAIPWRQLPGQPPRGHGWLPSRNPRDRLRDFLVNAIQDRIWARDGVPAHNHARALVGLPPLRSYFAQYDAADRVLVLTSQAFDFPAKRLAPNVRYVGTPFDDVDVPATAWTPPWPAADGRARVLVSLSTLAQGQAPVLHRVLAALAISPVHAVVTTGPSLDPAEFSVPPNVHLETFVPHAALLPHMTAMITQCGLGTLTKALAHGVPLVCIPILGDQPDNAARIVSHGAGVRVASDAPAEQIAQALQRVLAEPRFRTAAQRFSVALANEDGTERAARELESLGRAG